MRKKVVRIIAVLMVLLSCIGIAFSQSENKSIYYLLGMMCGVVAGIAFVALIMWIVRKMGGKIEWNCNKENAYDERQLMARGEAYKYAFFTMLLSVIIASVLDEVLGFSLLMSFAGMGDEKRSVLS